MENFIPGQRWISNTESELGLGLVLEAAYNRVTVLFLATGEKRIYARDNAPLTRVKFSPGDTIEAIDGSKITVQSVSENNGVITYIGRNKAGKEFRLEEMELNHHIQFNKPQDRLFTGQFDPPSWFSLRYDTWRRLREHHQSPVKGLMGGRTSLIAHQIYIAHECANRLAPRIMLADEVGLGKTIEAGMILHHRLINGLSSRILIIVPETLLHQWLVEMLRRFNLRFSIVDEERCRNINLENELAEEEFDEEPRENEDVFVNEQLVLCSQSFFSRYPNRQKQALEAGWDMVIVDEAHHLEWSEANPSPEYLFVEQLGLQTPSLILLTATPEQLGKESHFARLRLLDPDRFYSYSRYLEDEKHFEPVANAARALLAEETLTDEAAAALQALVKDDNVEGLLKNLNNPEKSAHARAQLINVLLDHHGTGRILFRNSRHTVQGFPDRERYGYALEGQENRDDLEQDPRFGWLVDTIKRFGDDKALLICKEAQTAIDLEQTLRNRTGIAAAVFHEGMTIIERDRAAAYFADQESSARLLICSEIGSEGRNFQFVHQLILWDLPVNPDLLQQRIGRLDRIGQKHIISIHVPYLRGSEQELLFRWYDEGLNAFRHNNSAAQHVADELAAELDALLAARDFDLLDGFIAKTRERSAVIEAELHQGRDQLLELNSCRKDIADKYIDALQRFERESHLWQYMEDVFDSYGVDTEFHSPDCFIIKPSDHLRTSHFPSLSEDGMTATINRSIALAREDFQFLTMEHPMVSGAMDLVISSETGNASINVVRHPGLKAGQFLLECLFVAECSAPPELQIGRFLPPTPIRVLIDQNKQDLTDTVDYDDLIDAGITFDKSKIVTFINNQRHHLTQMLGVAEQRAQTDKQELVQHAAREMLGSLAEEIKRMMRLQKVNPSIKPEEIEHLKDMTLLAHDNIESAELKLDAVRFLITN
ncbi:RNA polymerase-associated protein RapA [Candidatus Methylomicrobium oryzae]|jgi:ATP-dependent helicase HepA|uniref:RNA polymerase-associated protein RapA n=1 Tax=Candidatus Methylomicrobium oryzae TaxID=2802053 RepID=UPI001923D42C|nr:RNA polymerase-associated protein RapA [Methylomicrobium sp. RS1]MBL1264623.1 RNA polymerase-associated protein RapA [Methylomicrobium sp. RS1]